MTDYSDSVKYVTRFFAENWDSIVSYVLIGWGGVK